ncbi:MAG: UDP-N-acetylmuramate dehydrogenase [Clostridiales bacterium]|nr:UDP-N-acetylmuramate dehydrogenase [Clostridiales bacterium]
MTWYETLDEKIQQYLPDLPVEREAPLSRHTSFRIGGPARRMAFPQSREQLVLLMGFAEECGIEPLIMGNGTNLLIDDEGLDTLVIQTSDRMNEVRQISDLELEADAGVSLARLALFAMQQGLSGLEFAHGIPGSLGGGVCMNAGAYGGEMKQVVSEVEVLCPDGIHRFSGEEMAFSYRHSLASDQKMVILSARLTLQEGEAASIRAKMEELMALRKKSQPLEYPSAGSTFKRPEGNFAGTLIEQTGLKGRTEGGAQVSEKHAGFIINRGGATCHDVETLIHEVQDAVYQSNGIHLEPEVKIVH